MKTEFRRDLAQQSFEETIRKVGELIQLSRKVKAERVCESANNYPVSGFQNPQSVQLPPKNSKN